jgi:hypothetical protein
MESMNTPPIPSSWPEPQPNTQTLQCPHCEHWFELSWRLYWKAPFGILKCPSCRLSSKIKQPWWTYVLTGIGGLLGSAFACVDLYFTAGFKSLIPLGGGAGFIIVSISLDKHFGIRYGKLVKRH